MAFRANKLANRLAIYSKGGDPDLVDEEFNPLYYKVQQHNNKYFNVSSNQKDLNLRNSIETRKCFGGWRLWTDVQTQKEQGNWSSKSHLKFFQYFNYQNFKFQKNNN